MENKQPLVSVCCTTYNQEAYIRRCLDGILMQKTSFPIEILVHDDASTDATATIIREYEQLYPNIIKPIYQVENQYSKGIHISQTFQYPYVLGKYIALCEGDDYWTDPLKLQKQVDFLESHPDYAMCFHNVEVKAEDGCLADTSIYDHLRTGDYTGMEIISRWTVPTCSVLFRRECVAHIPENPGFRMGDNVLFLTCASCGKVYCLNEKMGVYRRNPGGWTSMPSQIAAQRFIEHYKAMKESFPTMYDQVFDEKLISFYGLLSLFQICAFSSDFWKTFTTATKQYGVRYWWSCVKWGGKKLRLQIVRRLGVQKNE